MTAWRRALAWGAAGAAALPAYAQETAPSVRPEIVVTGSPLNPRDVFDSPYPIDTITADDLADRLSRTFPEALKETPGVTVQKTGHGQGSPFIRGFTGYRNLLLVDGIRLNNGAFREGPNQYWSLVDPYAVERIEVLRGPASVLYGSDALGGTVLAESRDPGEPSAEASGGGRTFLRYASAEDATVVRQEFRGGADRLGVTAGVSRKSFGDVTAGRQVGTQPNTGYEEGDGDAKAVWRLDARQRIVAAFQRVRVEDAPRTHRTIAAKSWRGTTIGGDRALEISNDRDFAYLQYRGEDLDGFCDRAQASLSWQRIGERESRIRGSGARDLRAFDVDTLGLWTRLSTPTPLGRLTYGAEWYRDRVQSDGFNVSAAGAVTNFERGNVADDTTYDLVGLYVQDEAPLGGRVDLTAGVRFNHIRVDAGQVDFDDADGLVVDDIDETWNAVVGSLRGVYRADDHWNVIAGIGQGFRAPSVDDLTSISFALAGTLDIPNPDLDPERTTTTELGTRVQYDGWGAEVFGFYTDMNSVMQRVPVANPFFPTFGGATANQRRNFGDGTVYGAEIGTHASVSGEVAVFGGASWVYGVSERIGRSGSKRDHPLDKVNPATAHVGVRWRKPDGPVWLEGVLAAADDQDRLSPSDETDTQRIPPEGTPGYTIYTLRGGWRICGNATATLAIENVTDRDYRAHGSGQNEPGTNVIAGLELTY